MFGLRRKPEGFDWHKYVRTTILARRQARRDKLDGAREAALEQVQAAGAAAIRGAKVAGVAAKVGMVKGGRVALHRSAPLLRKALSELGQRLDTIGQWIARGARPIMLTLQRTTVAIPLALCGIVALGASCARAVQTGFDIETVAPLIIGALLFVATIPAILPRFGWSSSLVPKAGRGVALSAAAAVLTIATTTLLVHRGSLNITGTSTPGSLLSWKIPTIGAKSIEGRAVAVSGDVLRINGKLIRLSGIDAPDRGQVCTRQTSNKKWRCGETAQASLDRLVRGKTVRCETAGTDDLERIKAKCLADGKDVAGELATAGHVFASASLFGGYAFLEADAKQRKLGIWSGEAERPEIYRDRLWEAAKKAAPDGCPVKGRLTSSGAKIYLLPWSADYAGTSVRTNRGERWFCSEAEAAAAGWRAG
jgi:endonuclease YncB( thermonuclease family)